MTYPGPWEQGADYQRPFDGLYILASGTHASVDHAFTGGGAPFDDEMNTALEDLATAPGTTVTTGPGASMGVTATRGSAPFTSGTLTVEKDTGAAEWTAANLLDVGYYYQNYLAANRPADAVGIEYETAVAVGEATLHIIMNDSTEDSTSATNTAAAAPITVTLQGYDPTGVKMDQTLAQYPADTGTGPHPYNFNMTSVMGAKGETGLRVLVAKAGGWRYTNPNSLGLIKSGSTGGDIQMMYTLHPPRHRWLYATPVAPPGLPPLRQHPRRDGLGASTARRHYPPDRSVQASNRHAGGYF